MSILSNLDSYIKESYIFEGYELSPVEYDSGSNVSFEVVDGGKKVAVVKVSKIDGEAVDAVDDTYDFEDVYAEVDLDIEGDGDAYDKDNIIKWVAPKLIDMGYGENKIIFDGDEIDLEAYKGMETTEVEPDEVEDIKGEIEDIEGEDSFSIDDLDTEYDEEE